MSTRGTGKGGNSIRFCLPVFRLGLRTPSEVEDGHIFMQDFLPAQANSYTKHHMLTVRLRRRQLLICQPAPRLQSRLLLLPVPGAGVGVGIDMIVIDAGSLDLRIL